LDHTLEDKNITAYTFVLL